MSGQANNPGGNQGGQKPGQGGSGGGQGSGGDKPPIWLTDLREGDSGESTGGSESSGGKRG